MPPVGFEPTISAGEWPKTYALDRAANGTGTLQTYHNTVKEYVWCVFHYSIVLKFLSVFRNSDTLANE